MPITVDNIVAITEAGKNDAGEAEPCDERIPMTVDGRSCKDVAEMTIIIIIFVDAYFFLPTDRRFIAFIPIGVAAFPNPKRLADIFIVMYFSVSSFLTSLNILSIFLVIIFESNNI